MENNERRSGVDRRKCQRRKKIDEDTLYSELSYEIDCANKEIRRLSAEIQDIQNHCDNN